MERLFALTAIGDCIMLQPIKPTKSTTSTEATEPTSAVRPISEQRPGGTLQDRLYRMPEIRGASKPAASGNTRSLFQEYSIAKTLPAVPLAAADTTTAPGTFSSFANKYGTYADLMAGLTGYQKQPEPQQFISDKYGSAFIGGHLKSYADKYGMSKGTQFLESLYRADRLADARKSNPYYQPIMLKDMKEYFEEDLQKFSPYAKTNDGKGVEFTNKDWALGQGEIDSLRRVAEDNMLGQSGYEELLHRAYQSKKLDAFKGYIEIASDALSSMDSTSWGEIEKKIGFRNYGKISDLENVAASVQEMSASIGSGELSKFGSKAIENIVNMGIRPGLESSFSTPGVLQSIAGAVKGWMASAHQKENIDTNIHMVSDSGRLKTRPEDFNDAEKRTINDFRDYMKSAGNDISFNDVANALAAGSMVSLYKKMQGVISESEAAANDADKDRALQFSDSGVTLSKTYNPYGGKNV